MSETCYACEGPATLVRGPREVRVGDRVVTVEAEFMRCGSCGEVCFLPGQMREMQRAAAELVRREDGLLAPSEIVEFRGRYGLSQAALEKLIGAGPKTIGRWERGTVCPTGPTDVLLRELIENPDFVRRLAARKSVELREPAPAARRGA